MTVATLEPVTYQGIGVVTGFLAIPRNSGTVNVYNGDITNVLLLSTSPTPVLSNSIPVQPLTNATIEGGKPYYASAQSGTVATVTISASSQISPSPAQIAAQIGALGLATSSNQVVQTGAINNPGYGPAKDTSINALPVNVANQMAAQGLPAILSSQVGTLPAVAANTTWGPTTITFTTGGGYAITFFPSVAGQVCASDVGITHIDTGGNTTYVDRFTICTAGGYGNLGVMIRGNLFGNRIQVQGVTAAQAFINAIFASAPTVCGFNAAPVYSRPYVEATKPKVLPIAYDGVLALPSVSLPASSGTTTIYVLQPFSGQMSAGLTSSVANCSISYWISGFSVGNGAARLYAQYLGVIGGTSSATISPVFLDQRIHQLQAANAGSAASSAVGALIGGDYI